MIKNKYFTSYIYYISIEKNLGEQTVNSYKKEIETFFKYLKEEHDIEDIETEMINITENEDLIKSYLYYLVTIKENKKKTINRKITTLSNFFKYIAASKNFPEIKTSPMLLIKNQKEEQKLPIYLSIEECEKFLYGIKFFSRYATRDYALFQVFLSTGARLSEITNLKLDQIDLKNGVIRIYGKGEKEREVILTDEALKALKRYLDNGIHYKEVDVSKRTKKTIEDTTKRGRVPKVDTNIVFLNKYGVPFTEKGIYMLFRDLAKRIGIYKEGLSPHKLRHSFATLMVQSGMNVIEIKQMLGHSSLRSTQIYTHVDSSVLNKVKNLHPLNRNSFDDDIIEKIKNSKK